MTTVVQTDAIESEKVFLNTSHKIYFRDAKNISKDLEKESVHLVVTSPPYWNLKDYGNSKQIGFHDSITEYFDKLTKVWKACIATLKPGCKLIINIGDQFIKSKHHIKGIKKVYQIIPIHSMLVNSITSQFQDEVVYLGSINWSKVSTSNTSGGGKVMGSMYYPRNGYFFINREYVAIFKKDGKDPKVDPSLKELSRLSLENWQTYFKDTWSFSGEKQDVHIAMFPEELPERLLKMYTFVGDTVLDPFLGSGTTTKAAAALGRNSIGYEIGFNSPLGKKWKSIIKEKIENYEVNSKLSDCELITQFEYH